MNIYSSVNRKSIGNRIKINLIIINGGIDAAHESMLSCELNVI